MKALYVSAIAGLLTFTLGMRSASVADPLTTTLLPVSSAANTQSAQPTAGAPLLEITKQCPGMRYVGRDATFDILVTNRGAGPATNVVVTDALPAGVQFLSADNGGQVEGGNVVWRVGTIDAGQSKALKLTVKCNQITTVKNTARVTYCVELAASCEFPVKGVAAILLECVDDPDPIEVGGDTTYTITVTNQGSTPDTNIVIEAILAPEQDLVKSNGPTAAKAEGKTIRFAPLQTLAPQAKAVYSVTAKGTKAADVRFRVNLTSDAISSPVMETESTHIY